MLRACYFVRAFSEHHLACNLLSNLFLAFRNNNEAPIAVPARARFCFAATVISSYGHPGR
jgi:hypothetical protein